MNELQKMIARRGLERIGDNILRAARPSVQLVLDGPAGASSMRSRLGGIPTLPSPDVWPTNRRKPLTFLGQIRLDELGGQEAAAALPPSGVLSFFYDVEGMPWGDGTRDRGGWRVLYVDDVSSAAPVPAPRDAAAPAMLPAFAISFRPAITLPAPRSIELGPLGLTEDEFEPYWELRDDIAALGGPSGPIHRMFGHPDAIQGCMQRKVQFVSRDERLPEGVYSYYEHPRAAELIPGAHDWRLLLQIDSDERLGVMWGDAGRIFFWVHKDDLAARDFSKAWLFLQCY
jgi:uncharacterized protein YwqG